MSLEVNNEQESTSYYQARLQYINNKQSNNEVTYPYYFATTKTFQEYVDTYSCLEPGEHREETVESVAGRVIEIRTTGKLTFITAQSNNCTLQFMIKQDIIDNPDNYKDLVSNVARGDIVGVTGFVGKSKKGELSLFVKNIQVLTPCLRTIPKIHFGVVDEELRIRKRYLDLIANPESKAPFIIKNKVIKYIRNYLDNLGFMEVQTPIICGKPGGAAAKPFMTYYNDIKTNMSLRIAPELYLKQLLVGGFEKVYELGPQFRNESRDCTHNPEFLSLEFYWSYIDYNKLFEVGEEIISGLVKDITGSYILNYKPRGSDKEVQIDFTPPFKRIDLIQELETETGVKCPDDLGTEEARDFFDKLCVSCNVDCSHPRTTARLIDKLVGKFIEPRCMNPTYIMNHPLVMSPLAKPHRNNPQLTERFELFVNCFELCNAYTELNDPRIQRKNFESQAQAKEKGDDEAQPIDDNFIEALEFGLPPCGGFGLGIERLTMLLSNRDKIDDIILFPTLKPE